MNPSKRSQTLKEQNMERSQNRRQNIRNKINLLNEMNRDGPSEHVGVVIDTSAMELSSTHRALYADTVSNVCIIFTDIVNFSQISLDMKPIKVMDMLQDLFSRFDVLCDRFGIEKLETIGDAYICTTSMFDEDDKNDINAASNALSMAKEMVKEARRVLIPKKNNSMQTLEIRVGIHIGDLTCGVLGERLPKFTVFGSSVNMAARMEQTCLPSRIRVTKDFFDLLPDTESETVEAKEVISAKNMGDVETYLLNPLLELEGESESTPLSLYDEKVLSTHWENGCSSHNSLYD
jgi:class 3 adenylate cyclase